MQYIDGFVLPVPSGNKKLYLEHAAKAAQLFREYGALQVVECWGDDVPHGKTTDFFAAVKAEEGEDVVFSWILWASKADRDAGAKTMMEAPRMKELMSMPFDGRRMIMGGFEVSLEMAAS